MWAQVVRRMRFAVQLLLIELFLPGGTLIVIASLLARRLAPACIERWRARLEARRTLWPILRLFPVFPAPSER